MNAATDRATYVAQATNAALSEYDKRLTQVQATWAAQDFDAVLTVPAFVLATNIVGAELVRLEAFGGVS